MERKQAVALTRKALNTAKADNPESMKYFLQHAGKLKAAVGNGDEKSAYKALFQIMNHLQGVEADLDGNPDGATPISTVFGKGMLLLRKKF